MSWLAASLLGLAVALACGFAWYERARPDARIVALVGTLAAFAALGRIAFAAVPNVKPTTDIVLIAGYALGGAPGFAIGALAAILIVSIEYEVPEVVTGLVGVAFIGLSLLTSIRYNRTHPDEDTEEHIPGVEPVSAGGGQN